MPTSNWWVNGIPPKKLPQVGETERSLGAAFDKQWAAGRPAIHGPRHTITGLQFILQLDGESIVLQSRGGLLLGNL